MRQDRRHVLAHDGSEQGTPTGGVGGGGSFAVSGASKASPPREG
eukprot:CAMPEP_0182522130 /NCGR_PEP_ID=MMETSP1323-20130603/29_1 /TAXON_ID=236787 /ORGANISM="Florenciella parvula, Strain RCC1693" /LENGTH=43 /DNA_ID= /DNA_START= /DNA_END= /DNA_ORIENTATION=